MKGNIEDFMQQARQMQEKMQEKMQAEQQRLARLEVHGQAGAGLVNVTMTGRYDVRRVELDDAVLGEPKDVLEDLLAAAVNDAVKKVEANSEQTFGGMLPPGFKLPF